jgi:hypothetical protein
MKAALLASALLLAPSLARAQAPAGQDVYDMSCELFHHDADGSWNVTEPVTLQPAEGPIPLKPTDKFKPGTLFAGFDLGAALDKSCPH